MKILFYGDSITDMGRNRDENAQEIWRYGSGYPFVVASELFRENPLKHTLLNRGISGNRIVDLYARLKEDVWNEQPDVLSILIGINDIWHEAAWKRGVDIERWERFYRMMIEDTLKRLPDLKIIICEPFVLYSPLIDDVYAQLKGVREYARVAEKLAAEYGLYFLPLQKKFDEAAAKYGVEPYLFDGVHPMIAGATLIADEWIKLFREKIEK
ncbi:MAG: SGNH/GDSL hydrolase family protein [Clostridia bacterium]|nr:SGNH/GDSL hydrolase family protein [Clostridia bacterium]